MTGRLTCGLAALVLTSLTVVTSAHMEDDPGAVYALTNATTGNAVVRYTRSANGSLTPGGVFSTGGSGTGAGLGSQGAVIVSDDHRWLFAVNAGSNSVVSFRITPDGLEAAGSVASGGVRPTSVTFHHGILYVLNAGGSGNITGFRVDRRGRFAPIPGSTRGLSGSNTAPAQVQFDDEGETLVVTERGTNLIDLYNVDDDGVATGPFSYPSAGLVPFGFAVTGRNTLLVSEAGAGGGASSYRIREHAQLIAVSSMIMTGQRAACWAIVTKNGRHGYVTNAGTGNISGFALERDGAAALLNANGVTAVTGGNPTDMAMSEDSRFLCERVAALNTIAIFRVGASGSLTALPSLTGTVEMRSDISSRTRHQQVIEGHSEVRHSFRRTCRPRSLQLVTDERDADTRCESDRRVS